jgi:polyisoprenoid-binding protein YceI
MNIKLLPGLVLALAPALFGAEYTIDSAHSKAGFSVQHMMVSTVRGQFGNIHGTISYDQANPTAIKVEATIDTTTVNTSEPKRDAHLKSPDFFDVEKFPTMVFKSKSAKKTADGLAVTGDLTIHGVTKEVVLNVDGPTAEVKNMMGGFTRGASATTKISRKDFGLTWNKALEAGGVLVGDEVKITIDVEAARPADSK